MPDNDGTTNTTPAANNNGTTNNGTTNNAADNAETEVLGSVAPESTVSGSDVVAAPAAPAHAYAVSTPVTDETPRIADVHGGNAGVGDAGVEAPQAAPAGASAPPAYAVPVAKTASGKTQRRITVATLSLAGLIVLAGIFGSGVLLGTHLTTGGEASQGQMQGGPGGGFAPGGQAPTQGGSGGSGTDSGTGPGSGTRPGTDSGTDSGTGSGTDSGSSEGS